MNINKRDLLIRDETDKKNLPRRPTYRKGDLLIRKETNKREQLKRKETCRIEKETYQRNLCSAMRNVKWPTHTKRAVFIGNTPIKETYAYGKRPTKGMALPGLQHASTTASCCSTMQRLQYTATHCNMLQHAAT